MSDVPGSARLVLAANVVPLDGEATVFRAMLEGWSRQQRSRFFSEKGTIAPRIRLVKRFASFTGLYVNGQLDVPAGGRIKVPTPCGDS